MKKIVKKIKNYKILLSLCIFLLSTIIAINFSFIQNTISQYNNRNFDNCSLNPELVVSKNIEQLDSITKMGLNESMNKIHFIPNRGQWNCDVLYASLGFLYDIIIYQNRISIISKNNVQQKGKLEKDRKNYTNEKHVVNLFFEESNEFMPIEGCNINTSYNWFNEGLKLANIKPVNELVLKELYNGIDLRFYSNESGSLEFDWIVKSGANYKNIKMRSEGEDKASILSNGSLDLTLRFTKLNFRLPEVYQLDSQSRRINKCASFKLNKNISTFVIDDFIDSSLPLIIDPVLKWGSFFDAPGFSAYLYGGVQDAFGNLYLAGSSVGISSSSAEFSGAVSGYLNNPPSGAAFTSFGTDWLILKVAPNATSIIAYTFFGLPSVFDEQAHCISISPSGNRVFVGGYVNGNGTIPTSSITPFGASSITGTTPGLGAPCVIVLDNTLTSLIYGSLIGGSSNSTIPGVYAQYGRCYSDVTSIEAMNDDTYIIGGFTATDLGSGGIGGISPYMLGADNTYEGNQEMFLIKFNNLNFREWGSYIGGNNIDKLHDFRLTMTGDIAFVGSSNSTMNFTDTINPVNTTIGTGKEFVIGVIRSNGASFNTLSKFGGNGDDEFIGLTTRLPGELIACGSTNSTSMGILGTAPSSIIQNVYGGGVGSDFFIYRCKDIGGNTGSFGTYYGGINHEFANSIEVLPSGGGSLLIFGTSQGNGTPTINNIAGNVWFQSTFQGGYDMFFLSSDLNLNSVSLASYVGGPRLDYVGGSPITGRQMMLLDSCTLALFSTTHSSSHLPSVVSASGVLDNAQSNNGDDSWLFFALDVCDIIAGQVVPNCCDSIIISKTDSCCSHLESTCEVSTINISVANGTISDLFWNCGAIPSGYLGSSNFTYSPTTACPLALDICVSPVGVSPVLITYTITFSDSSICTKTDVKNCPCAVIKGEVWHDANANGLNENSTENGINGLEVELVDVMSGQVVSTSITQKNPITPSDDGYYNFPCVKPGMYYVRFDSLPNYTNTLTNQGNNDQIDSDITNVYGYYTTNKITVNNGDTICDLDGGFKDTLITSTSFFVQGLAKFGETKPMPYVNTILFDKVSRVSKSTLTDLRGAYSFYDLSSTSNYEIRLNFEDDYLSGVTTYDILQIQKHILGINEFSSPYKFIAADVNQTKTITAADISEIRKLILGVIPSFPKTKSWKFVNKNRMDPFYPMQFLEYADINISTLDKNNVNFEAIKMGDINSSALFTDGAQTRNSQALKLIGHTEIKGTTMKVSYQSLEELCVNGIQLGLRLPNGLKVNQIHFCGEKISENNYIQIVDELRISHNQMEMCTPKFNNYLLEIEFDIKTPVDEYEILQKVDFISEVYGCQNVIYPIEIIAETKANNFEITHIVPTVFSSEIEIGIFSNSSNTLQLDIYNTSGTNIYSNKFQITKSYSRNLIKDLDSVPPGVYVMHFQVGNSTKIRKIIKM